MTKRFWGFLTIGLLLGAASPTTGCSSEDATNDDDGSGPSTTSTGGGGGTAPAGLPVLGNNTHEMASVELLEIGTAADGLNVSRDLEFSPLNPNELWVVNRADDSAVIYFDPGTPQQTSQKYSGSGGEHFMAFPSALAMGDNGFMATIHEEDEQTQGPNGTPPDFMGPTLWGTDVNEFEGGHASHYDMLHNSPNGMGIAWQSGNIYWIFDGWHSAITVYDFQSDHGAAGADHSDGIVTRYVEGSVLWVENVPSHMEFDEATRTQLYIADTGNNRIAVLDTNTGAMGGNTFPNYDGSLQRRLDGAVITTLVDGGTLGMVAPSGLAVFDGHIYVSDNATSTIYAFTMEGEVVDWLVTGMPAGSLMGLEFDPEGRLYVADGLSNRVLRIAAAPQAEQ
jgi:hypothetical protein